MKLKIKDLNVSSGGILVIVLNEKDAKLLGVHYGDRVHLSNGKNHCVAVVDITDGGKNSIVKRGQVGVFDEVAEQLNVFDKDIINVDLEGRPMSIQYIKKKLKGKRLNEKEIQTIVNDIAMDKLSEAEMTYFVAASYIHELNNKEVVALTNAMINTGDKLNLKNKIVVDKHCIGGVAGNRTSMIVVPILAAAGLIVPKTSSRAITSAAGTADTMEVICKVGFDLEEMKNIIKKTNSCIVWGGAVNLAPVDDKIIKVEHPLSLDPTGQLLASILAKKGSVSSNHVLIDIPIGKNAKIEKRSVANSLARKFKVIGKKLGMKVEVIITDGSQPIGRGIGPALEAKDVLFILSNDNRGCELLKDKCLMMAGKIFEMVGKKNCRKLAEEILYSGKAYQKFIEIIKAQKGKITKPEQIRFAKESKKIYASKSGIVTHISNESINKLANIAGAPIDKQAGLRLYIHKGYKIKKGEPILTLYSDSKDRLKFALDYYKRMDGIEIK